MAGVSTSFLKQRYDSDGHSTKPVKERSGHGTKPVTQYPQLKGKESTL